LRTRFTSISPKTRTELSRRSDIGWHFLLIAAAIVFAFNCRSFWPGIVSNDSITTYAMAVSGHHDDWSPPLMALIWSAMPPTLGATGMLILNSLLLTGGLLLWGASLRHRSGRWAAAIFGVYFLPSTLIFGGLIWRDVLLAGLLLCSTGFLALHESRRRRDIAPGALDRMILCLATATGILGAMARTNGVFAFVPIAFVIAMIVVRNRGLRALVFCFLVAAPVVGNSVLYRAIDAEKTYVENSLFIFDIGGLSSHRENLFPGAWTETENKQIVDSCYRRHAWDVYMWHDCKFVSQNLKDQGLWGPQLKSAWFANIVSHPMLYLKNRMIYFATLIAPPWQPLLPSEPNTLGLDYKPGIVTEALLWISNSGRLGPIKLVLLAPLAWFAYGALSFLAYCRFFKGSGMVVPAVLLSALLYALAYAAIGVSNDYRYVYWSIIAVATTGASMLIRYLTAGPSGLATVMETSSA
jgi:hypothetical protein